MIEKKKISLMLVVILILQVMFPLLTVIIESDFTLFSTAAMENEGNSYYINTAEDFWEFAEMVNGGNSFSNKTVYLNNDIDLACNEEKQWVPMSLFKGNFEGQSHTISGIYIKSEEIQLGLFKKIETGTIKDLKIDNSYIESINTEGKTVTIGFVVALMNHYEPKIYNCTVSNSNIVSEVDSPVYAGGICGTSSSGTIDGCTSDVNINVLKYDSIGGIIGYNSGTVKKSTYLGNIKGGGRRRSRRNSWIKL